MIVEGPAIARPALLVLAISLALVPFLRSKAPSPQPCSAAPAIGIENIENIENIESPPTYGCWAMNIEGWRCDLPARGVEEHEIH